MSADDEILSLKCPEVVEFTLRGRRPEASKRAGVTSTVRLQTSPDTRWRLTLDGAEHEPGVVTTSPLLFEQTAYHAELIVHEPYDAAPGVLRVGGRGVRVRPRKVRGCSLWVCPINFGSEVGFVDVEFEAGGVALFRLRVEVFPAKLDYRTDYLALRADIQKQVRALIFAARGRTFQLGQTSARPQETEVEWLTMLRHEFEALQRAVRVIVGQPMRELHREREIVRGDRPHRADKASLAYLRTNPQSCRLHPAGHIRARGARYEATRLAVSRKSLTVDTPENRYVAAALRLIERRVRRDIAQFGGERGDGPFAEWIELLSRVERAVRRWLDTTFLAEIAHDVAMPRPTLALHLKPGYREFFSAHAALSRSIDLQGNLLEMREKDLSTLYELWCFIALANLIGRVSGMQLRTPTWLRVEQRRTVLELKRGQTSVLEWDAGEGQTVRVVYNLEDKTPTGAFRPDNTLEIFKREGYEPFRYIFDAKYRLADDADYVRTHDAPGPPVDAINRMHAYRDQLVRPPGSARLQPPPGASSTLWGLGQRPYLQQTVYAVVLYPYNGAHRGETPNRFEGSIDEVGIGGLPFLPSHTRQVETLLRRIIAASPETVEDAAPELTGVRGRAVIEKAHTWGIVADVWSREMLAYITAARVYPLAFGDKNPLRLRAEFVVFHQRGAEFGDAQGVALEAAIRGLRFGPRSQIAPPPPHREGELPEDLCIWFELDAVQPLRERLPDSGPRRFGVTTRLALEAARDVSELALIREPERRFVDECRRVGWRVRVDDATDAQGDSFDPAGLRLRFEVDLGDETRDAAPVTITFDVTRGEFCTTDASPLFAWSALMSRAQRCLDRVREHAQGHRCAEATASPLFELAPQRVR
jgi:predicted component of viral defense system (DUF524 family)